jgi:hypothetical protein
VPWVRSCALDGAFAEIHGRLHSPVGMTGLAIAGGTQGDDNRPMPARRTLLLALFAVSAAMTPAPAQAKEELIGVLVCGSDRCAQLHGQAVDATQGILAHRSFRRSGTALPFYDVLFVWRDSNGRTTTYGALRWAPKAGATRTWSRGPVWSRTALALTAALSTATLGLQPRPARNLDDPVEAVGPATAAARRKLAQPPATSLLPRMREPAGSRLSPETVAGLAAVLPLVAIAAAVALRRSRRPDWWPPRRRPGRSKGPI